MRAVRQRDTRPELEIRSALHGLGMRYRLQQRPLPELDRRADIVFRSAEVAVFVDGCFWHRCPEHSTDPKANNEWWAAKLAANQRRDRDTDAALQEAGWAVVRVWEHEDPLKAALRIQEIVETRR